MRQRLLLPLVAASLLLVGCEADPGEKDPGIRAQRVASQIAENSGGSIASLALSIPTDRKVRVVTAESFKGSEMKRWRWDAGHLSDTAVERPERQRQDATWDGAAMSADEINGTVDAYRKAAECADQPVRLVMTALPGGQQTVTASCEGTTAPVLAFTGSTPMEPPSTEKPVQEQIMTMVDKVKEISKTDRLISIHAERADQSLSIAVVDAGETGTTVTGQPCFGEVSWTNGAAPFGFVCISPDSTWGPYSSETFNPDVITSIANSSGITTATTDWSITGRNERGQGLRWRVVSHGVTTTYDATGQRVAG